MTRSPFVVSISDLTQPGDQRRETIVAPVEWRLEMSRIVPDPALVADLTLQAISSGILVRGTVEAAVEHTCRNCLSDFEEREHIEVAAAYLEDPEEDGYALEGDDLDLEQMIRDETMLGLPMLPQCGPDCAGVVTTPETDLNTPVPGDADGESSSPFEALRDLLDPGT